MKSVTVRGGGDEDDEPSQMMHSWRQRSPDPAAESQVIAAGLSHASEVDPVQLPLSELKSVVSVPEVPLQASWPAHVARAPPHSAVPSTVASSSVDSTCTPRISPASQLKEQLRSSSLTPPKPPPPALSAQDPAETFGAIARTGAIMKRLHTHKPSGPSVTLSWYPGRMEARQP